MCSHAFHSSCILTNHLINIKMGALKATYGNIIKIQIQFWAKRRNSIQIICCHMKENILKWHVVTWRKISKLPQLIVRKVLNILRHIHKVVWNRTSKEAYMSSLWKKCHLEPLNETSHNRHMKKHFQHHSSVNVSVLCLINWQCYVEQAWFSYFHCSISKEK